VVGGFPYSEGIYEDINKIICARFYWNPNISAEKTVKEYIAYEFSPAVVDSVWKAIRIFEQNHHRTKIGESAKEAFRLVKQADAQLTTKAKTSWRWRMIYLRAQIDNELFRTGGRLEGQTLKSAFEEVTRISHAENANQPIKPLKITDVNAKGELVPEATW
jgi:hypothetical protein